MLAIFHLSGFANRYVLRTMDDLAVDVIRETGNVSRCSAHTLRVEVVSASLILAFDGDSVPLVTDETYFVLERLRVRASIVH